MDRTSKRTVIVPLDHGVTLGPVEGIVDLRDTVNQAAEGGANAVIEHKGMIGLGHRGYGKDIGLIIHLSASTNLAPDPNKKVLVTGVEEAIRKGADAVSIHINIGAADEESTLQAMVVHMNHGGVGNAPSKRGIFNVPRVAVVSGYGVHLHDLRREHILVVPDLLAWD